MYKGAYESIYPLTRCTSNKYLEQFTRHKLYQTNKCNDNNILIAFAGNERFNVKYGTQNAQEEREEIKQKQMKKKIRRPSRIGCWSIDINGIQLPWLLHFIFNLFQLERSWWTLNRINKRCPIHYLNKAKLLRNGETTLTNLKLAWLTENVDRINETHQICTHCVWFFVLCCMIKGTPSKYSSRIIAKMVCSH